ncbi:MAG: DUF1049 domain-containing protein [Desulfuromonas sp.]|nr:MAG: DUF1049 domain-containing protein [Desulfuromonas sp.]
MKLKLISIVLSVILISLFALQNIEQVEVTFLFWGFTLPRSLLMLTLFCLGILCGISISTIAGHKKRR